MNCDTNKLYIEFYKKNKLLVNSYIIIVVGLFPLEITFFSFLSKAIFNNIKNKKKILKSIIIFIICILFLQVLYTISISIYNKIVFQSQIYIRDLYISNVLEKQSEDVNTSETIRNLDRLPQKFFKYFETYIEFWIPTMSILVIYSIYCLTINKVVGTILSGLNFSLFYFLKAFLNMYSNKIFESYMESLKILKNYENYITNIDNIKIFHTKEQEIKKVMKLEQIFLENRNKLLKDINFFKFFIIVLMLFVNLICLIYVYKKESFSVFISFATIVTIFLNNFIKKISKFFNVIYSFADKKLIDSLELCRSESNTKLIALPNKTIVFNDISFGYDNNSIISNFSCEILEQQNVLIKGEIGSGKSTLIKLLLGWYSPIAGTITIGGNNIKELSSLQLANEIYLMPQNVILFDDMTITENIFYNKEIKSLNNFNLPESFINILDKKVQKNGINLSGGQKRIVLLLRTYFNSAPIVILDEPISNIDKNTIEICSSIIKEISKNRTLICISHTDINIEFDNIIDLNKTKNI